LEAYTGVEMKRRPSINNILFIVFLRTALYRIHHKKAIPCPAATGRSQPKMAFSFLAISSST
jgi:hypothetical protein